jgi:hypothetical protein
LNLYLSEMPLEWPKTGISLSFLSSMNWSLLLPPARLVSRR